MSRLLFCRPSHPAVPSVYDLELVSPRASGSAPSADDSSYTMPSGHRIFSAYPGLTYEIRAVVIGGAYPYRFALANAPDGMSVDGRGVITWTNPQSNAEPTLTVTDAEGTQVSSSWAITVSTSPFVFLSPSGNDSTGSGTLASPWQTIAKLRTGTAGTGGTEGKIVYFRAGTYDATLSSIAADYTGGGSGMTFRKAAWGYGRGASDRWLAYPGESVTVDHGFIEDTYVGTMLENNCHDTYPPYLDGITFQNFSNQAWRFNYGAAGHYGVVRQCVFQLGENFFDSDNPTSLMFATTTEENLLRRYWTIQDCEVSDMFATRSTNSQDGSMFKIYACRKLLIEDCEAYDAYYIGDLKANCPRFEVRGNWLHDCTYVECGILGNMNGGASYLRASGEIRYNRITARASSDGDDALVVRLNQDVQCDAVHVYRNTFHGGVQVSGTAISTTGPFYFNRNVIVNNMTDFNSTDRVSYFNDADDLSRIVLGSDDAANVVASRDAGVIDEAGSLALTGASRTAYLGTKGYEVS